MTEQDRATYLWMAREELDYYDSLEDQLYDDDVEKFQNKLRWESAIVAGVTAIAVLLMWRK